MAKRIARTAVYLTISAVVALAILDAVTTLVGIRRGLFREVNPLLEAALAVHVAWFLLLKGGCTMLWSAVMIRESWRRWIPLANAAIGGAYGIIVLRSLWHLG